MKFEDDFRFWPLLNYSCKPQPKIIWNRKEIPFYKNHYGLHVIQELDWKQGPFLIIPNGTRGELYCWKIWLLKADLWRPLLRCFYYLWYSSQGLH